MSRLRYVASMIQINRYHSSTPLRKMTVVRVEGPGQHLLTGSIKSDATAAPHTIASKFAGSTATPWRGGCRDGCHAESSIRSTFHATPHSGQVTIAPGRPRKLYEHAPQTRFARGSLLPAESCMTTSGTRSALFVHTFIRYNLLHSSM